MRQGACLSVVILDVDHFRTFNEREGHLAGDACLRRIASALDGVPRRMADLLARMGGNQFACLMPWTGLEEARRVAGTLWGAVEALAIPHPDSPLGGRITATLGVACRRPERGEEPGAILAAAGRFLEQAKRAGRNRIAFEAEPEHALPD